MTTPQTTNQEVENDDEVFAEEVGAIVFQSALMQFLAEADEEKSLAFEKYVEENAEAETFMDDLCNQFPEFEELLKQEMIILQEEMKEIIPATDAATPS